MQLEQATQGDAALHDENIGGIDETDVEFPPDVTVLVGRNATNRTSLLHGVMAALGSEDVSIKGDADEAIVELQLGDDTYTRQLTRHDGTVVADGEPYLDDPELADLFAFLLRSNEARQAVARGDDLRDIIMRPVDTDAIEAEIDAKRTQREAVEDELAEIDSLNDRLPELETERSELEAQIEQTKANLEATEDELEAAEYDIEETQEEQAKLEETLDELQSLRGKLDDVRYELETERESLSALRQERTDAEQRKSDLPETPDGRIEEIDEQIADRRNNKQALESEISDLKSIIKFNEEQLAAVEDEALTTIDPTFTSDAEGAVTDQLLEDDTVRCWTCGSEVEADQIETMLDSLRETTQDKLATVSDVEADIDELEAERTDLQDARHVRERIKERLADLDDEIDRTEATIEDLETRKAELTDEIETVEADVEDRREDGYSDVLDLHREANQLEYDLGRLETDLADVDAEVAEIEDRIGEEAELEARRDEIQAEIDELRTSIERLETTAIEQFNEHMDTLLELLDYANLERIWLERVETQVQAGRGTTTTQAFELHVVRSTESGVTYEDTVAHLSESEREITGLVFALAGYLAHDVYEEVPFMLLDSLEAIDSDRIATLVEYLAEYTGYLLVALLPEDAEALADEYTYVTEI